MKTKFTFLVVLFLLTTSIYAVKQTDVRNRKHTGNFLKNRIERTIKSTEHGPLQRKMEFQKQANSLKSAQAVKQRLDSYTEIVWDDSTSQWVPDIKFEFTYDANWNLDHDFGYEWDEETPDQLFLVWKSDYSYVNGNMTLGIYYGLDENTNQITVDWKEAYSYDANGNMTQGIEYEWDKISNQFITRYKYYNTYDAGGNITQEIYSYFDTNQLETKTKTENIYNNDGKLTRTTSFQFSKNTNEWIKGNTEEYTYDSKGNKKLVVLTEHTGSINGVEKYVTYNKEEYTYDSEGNNTLVLKTHLTGWSSNGGIEEYRYGYEKDEYTYDVNGQVTQYLNSRMENNGLWVVYYKNTTVYDDKGNTTQEIGYEDWDEQTNQWRYIYKYDYTYDTKYTSNDLIVPWWWEDEFDFPNSNMITEIKAYNWNFTTNEWESDEKVTLSYSPVNVTSVKPFNSLLFSVYPNPCSESFSISFPTSSSQINFELFDLQGRMLIQKEIINHEKISMESLKSGMYLYKLNIEGKIQSGKLIKE